MMMHPEEPRHEALEINRELELAGTSTPADSDGRKHKFSFASEILRIAGTLIDVMRQTADQPQRQQQQDVLPGHKRQ